MIGEQGNEWTDDRYVVCFGRGIRIVHVGKSAVGFGRDRRVDGTYVNGHFKSG